MPTFEELSDLAQFVKPNKIKDLVIVGTTSNPTTKLDQLYHGLTYGHFVDDAMAAEQVLGCSPRDAAYYKLKGRLYEKLLTTVLFIDIDQVNFLKHQRAHHLCMRQLLAVKTLIIRGARMAAIPTALRGLQNAEQYELTDLALAFAKHLRLHYGTIVGDTGQFKKYNSLVRKYAELYMAELKAEEYYTELMVNYVNSSATKEDVLGISERFSHELRELLKKNESYQLYFLSYLVFILRFQVANDYKSILKVCQEALAYFEAKKHLVSPTAIFHYSFKMASAYIHLKDYELAEENLGKCLTMVPEGVSNWFTILEYHILVCFRTKNFQKAYIVFRKGISYPSFSKQYEYLYERWKILEAFMFYLILRRLIVPEKENKEKKFRINKFLNEVPTYSKDKRGNNITILILHVLLLLQQKKYGEIIDRVESLKTYSHRYLRQDDTFRSNCFIKMLLQLPAASFHKKGVIRKAKKYWDKLQTVPLEKANQSVELEIVPYETLWEFVLDSLDNKFH